MTSRMLEEARQAPQALAHGLAQDAGVYAEVGERLRGHSLGGVLTVGRGSSDHAAHYLAYLAMARLGRLVTSLPMSLVTLHASALQCQGLTSLAFSQSGQSPDLVAPTAYVRAHGGHAVAVVNDTASPLAQAAQWVLPLHAGEERSVAATKSYLAQLVAGARLVAAWQDDQALAQALQRLPQALQQAVALDWSAMTAALSGADRLYVIGRGLGLAVAMEAALKFKEVCGIQAEAFSGAELRHGPMALVGEGYPVLVLAPRGPAQAGLLALAADLRARGASVLLAAPAGVPGSQLPLMQAPVPELDPIALAQAFYPAVEALARARGMNPDEPRHLAKVTRTH